ncbi:MAG: sigma-70 family RNA polymerase sigma factor [Phycisphaeraceae bacterium]|nr:sigma-70 family RNA polymerase sigma factor [Phycisphaeraceae bacterium]
MATIAPTTDLGTQAHLRTASAQTIAGRLSPARRRLFDKLLAGPIDFMDDPEFHKPDARRRFGGDAPVDRPSTAWYHQILSAAAPSVRALSAGMATPLLTEAEEKQAFLQFNYCRFRAEWVRQEIEGKRLTQRRMDELLMWAERAGEFRELIAEYNIALVLAMAKRFPLAQVDLPEMVSEGNMALLRAIEKFNIGRGFKFSTYACRAILKAFGRLGRKDSRHRSLFPVEFEPDLERSDHNEVLARDEETACAEEVRRIVDNNISNLTEIEQQIIDLRFNMSGKHEEQKLTLAQVGTMIGLTKERVRQIQNKALLKIRQTLEATYLDGTGEIPEDGITD